jgi:tetratricopeptide (TPR) repeat protein
MPLSFHASKLARICLSGFLLEVCLALVGFAQKNENGSPSPQTRFQEALQRSEAGEIKSALEMVENLLREDPANFSARMLEAHLLEQDNRLVEAQQAYEEALGLLPNDPEILYRFGCHWLLRTEWEKAIQALQKSLQFRPRHKETLYYLAQAYHLQGDESRALKAIENARNVAPESASILRKKGQILMGLGRYANALPCLLQAQRIDPSLADVDREIGKSFLYLMDIPNAISCLEKASQKNPADLYGLFLLAESNARLSRWGEARAIYQRIVEREPNNSLAHLGLGQSLVGLKDFAAAILPLRRALELDSKQIDVHFQLSKAYRALGRIQEAEQEMKQFQVLKDRLSSASDTHRNPERK